MPFSIVRNTITAMTVDVIVNAANNELKKGSGVCHDIFMKAGEHDMHQACREFGIQEEGSVIVTPAFSLPSRYVFHAVGPIWRGGRQGEAQLLKQCYQRSLELACEHHAGSIAFPLISTGALGFPKSKAMHIAVSTITAFLLEHELSVFLAVFDETSFLLSRKLYRDIQTYIDSRSVEAHLSVSTVEEEYWKRRRQARTFALRKPNHRTLEDSLQDLEKPFSRRLFELISQKQVDEVAVYKRANIDRKLFSKIRSIDSYQPSKTTAAAFAVALELDLEETQDLLRRAGFSLSASRTFDVIIEYCITHGIYNIHEINEILFSFDQPLLGGQLSPSERPLRP